MTPEERRRREDDALCDGVLRLLAELRRRQLAGPDGLEPARVNVPTAKGDTAWRSAA